MKNVYASFLTWINTFYNDKRYVYDYRPHSATHIVLTCPKYDSYYLNMHYYFIGNDILL